ncbi:MAG TPA: IS110 family transposase [Acidimicrobiales bacterium]|nr:IS110 family transposase [Acidimicrobiales bacterium]
MASAYVGIDLHRRRTVIVTMDAVGDVSSSVRIDNDPLALAREVAKAGVDADVVLEATYGWYWAVDVLQQLGVRVHLAHPLGLAWGHRRRKDDFADARDLADLFRLGRLPEAWIAPPALRELREVVRHRTKLVFVRSGFKAQVHAVLAKEGVRVPMTDLFGNAGRMLLNQVELAPAYRFRVQSLLRLIEASAVEIRDAERWVRTALDGHRGFEAIQAIGGVGETIAAIFVAEIGDIDRFERPAQLCSWAGLTPRHRESDTTVVRGRITKQGSTLVRFAAVEAAMRVRAGHPLYPGFESIAARRGRRIARVAMARRILELAFYGLRDGHIRFLDDHRSDDTHSVDTESADAA